jgi:hypothetical protein
LSEPEIIKALFDELMLAPLQRFPKVGVKLDVPTQPGVYVLYGSKGKVLYVGLARGITGLRSRLMHHLRLSDGLASNMTPRLETAATFANMASRLEAVAAFAT